MWGKSKFSEFQSHRIAKKHGCFNCCTDMSSQKHKHTEYAVGNGHYSVTCPKCGFTMFYDLTRELSKK